MSGFHSLTRLFLSCCLVGVLLLVAPGGTFDSNGQFEAYESLKSLGGPWSQMPDGLKRWYEMQLSRAGAEFVKVHELDHEMLEYGKMFQEMLGGFNQVRCPFSEDEKEKKRGNGKEK